MILDDARLRIIVGLIAVVTTLSVVAVLLAAASGAFADDYQLTARTSRAGFGLDASSEVKIRGVTVGGVESIELLDDGTVELALHIRKHVQIPVDATATVEPLSVFGPKFVDIRPGTSEIEGPFLPPGASMGAIVGATELAETLDAVATLLESVDTDDVATIVTELGRGLDGLGEELGSSIDAAASITERLAAKRPAIERILVDARALAATLSQHGGDVATIVTDGRDILRVLDEQGEAFGAILAEVSELAVRGDDLLGRIGDDLDPAVLALERGAGVLREQLQFLPDFVEGLDAVSALLSTGLLQWDRGEGRWGGLGHGIFDFSPCGFVADATCPPRQGFDG